MAERLRVLMCKPLEVLGQNESLHVFAPQFSVGTVTVTAADAIPAHVIDQAEQLALAHAHALHGGPESASAPLVVI